MSAEFAGITAANQNLGKKADAASGAGTANAKLAEALARMGSNADAATDPSAASGSVFAKLRGLGNDADTLIGNVGGTGDGASPTGSLMARLAEVFNRVGANSAPAAGTLSAKLDDALARVGATGDAASPSGSLMARLAEVHARLTSQRAGDIDLLYRTEAGTAPVAGSIAARIVTDLGTTAAAASATGSANAKLAEVLARLTSTRAGYLDAAVSSRAAAADYTATRAGYLDHLRKVDALALATVPTAGSMGDHLKNGLGLAADAASASGTANAKLAEVLARLTSTRAGYLDAAVSSRASPAQVATEVDAKLNAAVPTTPTADSLYERVKALDDNFTATRAGKLDNLDAAVSSRAAAADWTTARAAKVDNLDATVTSRATPADVGTQVDAKLNAAVPATPTADSLYERVKALDDNFTATRAGKLDNLDATIASRLAAASYTAPDNATIGTISTKVGTNADLATDAAAASGTLFSKLRDLGADVDTLKSATDGVEGALGTTADVASPTGTANAKLAEALARVGATGDAALATGSLMARLAEVLARVPAGDVTAIKAYVDGLESGLGATGDLAADASGATGSLFAKVRSLGADLDTVLAQTDTLEASLGATGDVASASGTANAKLAEVLARLTSTRAGYLDAAVTSRATPAQVASEVDLKLNTAIGTTPTAGSVYERVKTLGDNYTATRAGKLDNLDAPVSSRASATDYTAARAAKLDNLDATVGSRATQAQVGTEVDTRLNTAIGASPTAGSLFARVKTLSDDVTTARAGKLDNLDATVASRATPAQVATEVDNKLNAAIPTTPLADSLYERVKTLDDNFTATRAAKLDNLDATVASRLAAAAYVAPDNSTIATLNTKLGANTDAATDPSAASGTVFGKLRGIGDDLDTVKGYVDALEGSLGANSDLASATGTAQAKLAELLARLPSGDIVAIKAFVDGVEATVGANTDAASPTGSLSAKVAALIERQLRRTTVKTPWSAGVFNWNTGTIGTTPQVLSASTPEEWEVTHVTCAGTAAHVVFELCTGASGAEVAIARFGVTVGGTSQTIPLVEALKVPAGTRLTWRGVSYSGTGAFDFFLGYRK